MAENIKNLNTSKQSHFYNSNLVYSYISVSVLYKDIHTKFLNAACF